MFKPRFFPLLALLIAVFLPTVLSAQVGSPVANGARIFPLSEIRVGLKGKAYTVFQGSEPEEFGVEVLGVVPNAIGPRQDMIIGRLSGANAERTFVFAGMSGSPFYIDGRLVGAISYSFPFAKEPICGITPFEQMDDVVQFARPAGSAKALKAFSLSELRSDTLAQLDIPGSRPEVLLAENSVSSDLVGAAFVPISTPIYFSGITAQALAAFASPLTSRGFIPVAASGGGSQNAMARSDAKTLLGGDSVVVHLARGDLNISAAGTVTLRDGEKIYAFGHPFFSLGATNLPMSESHVVTVIPNTNNSFKLAVPDAMVGTMTQDRSTGIYGILGQSPKMIPVKVRLKTSRGQTREYNFESVLDELLTPLIVNAGVGNALASQERTVGDLTIEVSGQIRVKGEEPIRLERRFAGPQAQVLAAAAAAVPLGSLLRAGFEGMEISGVTLDLTAIDGARTSVIERIEADKTRVRAGENVELRISQRTQAGTLLIQNVSVKVPSDVQSGDLTITVGDGAAVSQNAAVTQFTPKNVSELIETINQIKRPDRVFVIITRPVAGTVIGSKELPNLPPSMLATINSDRSAGGSKATTQSTVREIELPFGEYLATGSQTLTIEVVR